MRIFAFIFSLYVIFLTTLPCEDSQMHQGEVNSAEGQKHSEHHRADGCSPFCVCDCCSTTVTEQPAVVIATPSRILETEHFAVEVNSASYYFPHIWQPPKLS